MVVFLNNLQIFCGDHRLEALRLSVKVDEFEGQLNAKSYLRNLEAADEVLHIEIQRDRKAGMLRMTRRVTRE